MKKIVHILTTAALLVPASALAFDDEFLFPTDSRIRMLPYDESDVYTIATKYGYQTSVVFAQGEEIHTISIGDRSLWQVIPAGNRLFIRPLDEDVMTNMTVLTNKHSYQFDLKSVDASSKNTSIMYVAKFVYPEDVPQNKIMAETSPYDSHMSLPPEPPMMQKSSMAGNEVNVMPDMPVDTRPEVLPVSRVPSPATSRENYRYTYSGPDALAPLKVFDNGKSTFFQYPAGTTPLPHAYIVLQDGSEKPVAHYVHNGLMIVDDTAGEWLLRSDAGNIMVYNETRNPN